MGVVWGDSACIHHGQPAVFSCCVPAVILLLPTELGSQSNQHEQMLADRSCYKCARSICSCLHSRTFVGQSRPGGPLLVILGINSAKIGKILAGLGAFVRESDGMYHPKWRCQNAALRCVALGSPLCGGSRLTLESDPYIIMLMAVFSFLHFVPLPTVCPA